MNRKYNKGIQYTAHVVQVPVLRVREQKLGVLACPHILGPGSEKHRDLVAGRRSPKPSSLCITFVAMTVLNAVP